VTKILSALSKPINDDNGLAMALLYSVHHRWQPLAMASRSSVMAAWRDTGIRISGSGG
jgi:hypothetical protein